MPREVYQFNDVVMKKGTQAQHAWIPTGKLTFYEKNYIYVVESYDSRHFQNLSSLGHLVSQHLLRENFKIQKF